MRPTRKHPASWPHSAACQLHRHYKRAASQQYCTAASAPAAGTSCTYCCSCVGQLPNAAQMSTQCLCGLIKAAAGARAFKLVDSLCRYGARLTQDAIKTRERNRPYYAWHALHAVTTFNTFCRILYSALVLIIPFNLVPSQEAGREQDAAIVSVSSKGHMSLPHLEDSTFITSIGCKNHMSHLCPCGLVLQVSTRAAAGQGVVDGFGQALY
jgi:hypothetical protein